MKVHFGGSGKGSEELSENYILIRDTIRELGHSITRDWLSPAVVKKTPSLEVAYQETIKAINKADVVILEGTIDSSSVGKQLSSALNKGVPVLILNFKTLNNNSSLEKFLDRKSLKLVKKVTYNKVDIKKVLSEFFTWAEDNTKLVRFNLEIERDLDNYLRKKAKISGTSKAEEIRKLILKDMENST